MSLTSETRQTRRLATLEAALYTAGRPVNIDGLKRVVRTRSDKVVRKLVRALAKRYDERGSSLEIKELPGGRVVLRLRTEFAKMMRRFAKRPLLTLGPLKTLSYVAYYQPIEQRKVAAERGSHVYAHLKMMEQMGLITRERNPGVRVMVKTTSYFSDYFGFSHDPIKSRLQLRMMFSSLKITKLDNGDENGMPRDPTALTSVHSGVPPDMVDGVPEGLMEYPTSANRGSS